VKRDEKTTPGLGTRRRILHKTTNALKDCHLGGVVGGEGVERWGVFLVSPDL